MRCAAKAVVFRAFSFSGTRFNMSTTAARPSRSNPLPLHPRAQHVMDYWFAKGWESADPGDTRQQCMRMWFGGGPDIDKVGCVSPAILNKQLRTAVFFEHM
jgi:hypothetical protein